MQHRDVATLRQQPGKAQAAGPVAMAYAKEATNRSLHGDLGANFVHEADLFAILFSTEDAKEGLRAFTEKRPAKFIGR